MVHLQSTSVSLISLPQVSPHYTTFPYCAVTNLFLENSPMVHLQSTQVNRNRHCNGACTKHPWQSDLSLQWCMYGAPMAIRFVSPMVHLHMHLFAPAKTNFSHRSASVHFLALGQHCPHFLTSAQHPARGWEGGGKRGSQEGSVQDRNT